MLMLLFLFFNRFYRGRISMMAATTDIRFVIKGAVDFLGNKRSLPA